MARELRYADAVKLLGGTGPLLTVVDKALGAGLAVATAGGSTVALSLFDAKSEVVRLSEATLGRLPFIVRDLPRHNRNQRLRAAHAVLVVTSLFESLEARTRAVGADARSLSRHDQISMSTGTSADGSWLSALLAAPIPAPSADLGPEALLRALHAWYAEAADRLVLADPLALNGLPDSAVEHYEAAARDLAAEIPEFALWLDRTEALATGRGLLSLEATLLRVTSHRDPERQRAALAHRYRAELHKPILGGDAGDILLPALGSCYLDPRFRAQEGGPGARPAAEDWWTATPGADLGTFLARYLTTGQATEAPLLLLGQPGAGKSTLTRVLAARLPAADFLVVRVPLREVRAEAEIQDQIEQAVRATIGETVSWAELAQDADRAMPVVLLDGFDELLQVTGVHQSDYLHRVAAFQEREALLGRPVAVVVTSRSAVADRARLPTGCLVVRLEPFDEPQIASWVEIWNSANRPLSVDAVLQFPDLAGQPLLLLMLAIYAASGNALQDLGGAPSQLYEKLLSEFAAREVRRIYPTAPDSDLPRLVELELQRLSVVAFAMFHRGRLWVTSAELDADLAGLGLAAAAAPGDFRGVITPGQEMVGRFFFIQRAQALQEDQRLMSYEFLHATFGEYLVARLTVQAVRDAVARSQASTLSFQASRGDDDLLLSLLGYTPLTSRNTVMPFVVAALEGSGCRPWLVDRLRVAVTKPQFTPRAYQPVDKRIDHWMATYSFNLMLLTLAAGGELSASELFNGTDDPAMLLRDTSLQWRGCIPNGIWLDAVERIQVIRGWSADGRRDLRLAWDEAWSGLEDVEVPWLFDIDPAGGESRGSFIGFSNMGPAVRSMHLSGSLSEDLLRHAIEPLFYLDPASVITAVHGTGDGTRTVAHNMVRLWVNTGRPLDPEKRLDEYRQAAIALLLNDKSDMSMMIRLFLRCLVVDAGELPASEVENLIGSLALSRDFRPDLHTALAERCQATANRPGESGS